MAGAFGQEIRTPLVQEATIEVPMTRGVGLATTVLTNVSSLHAKEITVMLVCTAGVQSVSLVLYGRAKKIAVTTPISGPIPANTPTVLRYGLGTNQGIGQVYDVIVTNADAGANTATVWTAARS